MNSHSQFTQNVIRVIQSIPHGTVVSYGQVATYVGVPRGARQVGWILQRMEGKSISTPWWRVINNQGVISIRGHFHNDKELQKQLLEQEGIEVNQDYTLEIEKYRFKASETQLKEWGLSDSYRERVLEKYGL